MEFATDMNSSVLSSNRDRQFNTTTADNQPAMSWKAHYGYLYLNGFNDNMTIDGMNEMGLSFEYLYLPGETTYQTIASGQAKKAVPYYHFGDWILSNFNPSMRLKMQSKILSSLQNHYPI